MLDWFNKKSVAVRKPLTPVEVEDLKTQFKHRRSAQCSCGSAITIRSREPHDDGVSQFQVYPKGYPGDKAGHGTRRPSVLNWAELLEERGWSAEPVQCPACRCNLTRDEYKTIKREIDRLRMINTPESLDEAKILALRVTPPQNVAKL